MEKQSDDLSKKSYEEVQYSFLTESLAYLMRERLSNPEEILGFLKSHEIQETETEEIVDLLGAVAAYIYYSKMPSTEQIAEQRKIDELKNITENISDEQVVVLIIRVLILLLTQKLCTLKETLQLLESNGLETTLASDIVNHLEIKILNHGSLDILIGVVLIVFGIFIAAYFYDFWDDIDIAFYLFLPVFFGVIKLARGIAKMSQIKQ